MFDVIVLGGGPGGYEAASLAGAKGLSTCLIEKKHLGGTCLNEGCIPLKYFLHTSKTYKEMAGLVASGVVQISDAKIMQKSVVANKDMIVEGLRQSVASKLEFNKVQVVEGTGEIKSVADGEIVVSVDGQDLRAKKLIIATGSSERKIEIEGTPSIPVIYSSDFLNLDIIPEKLTVVGAGVIGLEAASYFADLGTKVTLVDIVERVGGAIDSEIEKTYERILKRNKVALKLGYSLKAVNGNKVSIEGTEGREDIESDVCLIAVGRVPNVEGIGLEAAGINFDRKGITIDDSCRTNVESIFAVGDVTGKMMLAHTAYHQAKVVVDVMTGVDAKVRYDLIPQIIYSNPEITTVGLTEDACVANGITYVAKSIPMTYSGKYFAEHGRDGAIIKMIADESGKVLGCSIIGNTGSEIGLFIELLLKTGGTISDLHELIYPHPTMGEVIKELAEQF